MSVWHWRAPADGAKLPPPTVFPAPGTYFNTTSLSLRDEVPGTEIHYTWDGSEPTASSPVYDPREVLFIGGVYDGNKGLQTGYTLRAVAIKQGMAASDPVTFSYRVERRDRTAYISEEVAPGVRMIRDSDNDKMFLIRGSKRYALIDSGMGRGELRNYISQFTGGLPLVVIFTHSHGDHIGQSDQFIAESTEYIGAGDRDATADFLQKHGATREQIACTPQNSDRWFEGGPRRPRAGDRDRHRPHARLTGRPGSGHWQPVHRRLPSATTPTCRRMCCGCSG